MKMKSGFSLLLVLALLLGMAVTTYAAENESVTETFPAGETFSVTSPEIPVEVTTTEQWSQGRDESTLGVKITWSNEALQISAINNYDLKWNPVSLKYEKDPAGTSYIVTSANGGGGHVRVCEVTNLSLYDVDVEAVFNPVEALKNSEVLVSMTDGDTKLTKATVVGDPEDGQTGTEGETSTVYLFFRDMNAGRTIAEAELTSIGTVSLTFSKATS